MYYTKKREAMPPVLFLFVDFSFKRADIRKISVFLVIIKTVADNKFIGNLTADIIGCEVNNSALRLVKQSED